MPIRFDVDSYATRNHLIHLGFCEVRMNLRRSAVLGFGYRVKVFRLCVIKATEVDSLSNPNSDFHCSYPFHELIYRLATMNLA